MMDSVPGLSMLVSTSPGAIALTRTPSGPKSCAISRVKAARAAFDVAYAGPANGCTREPAIDVTLTTGPANAGKLSAQAAREDDRCKKVHAEDVLPSLKIGVQCRQSVAVRVLRGNPRIVDQRMQPAVGKTRPDVVYGPNRVLRIRQVDNDMVFCTARPGTAL